MQKKRVMSHFVVAAGSLIFTALLVSCVTMVPVNLSDRHRGMVASPAGGERIIDRVWIQTPNPVARHPQDTPPQEHRLGAPRNVPEDRVHQGHPDAQLLDGLASRAQAMYPNEAITIRNASRTFQLAGTEPRTEVLSGGVTRTIHYNRFNVWVFADIVTTEPAPQPISTISNIPMDGQTAADIFRQAVFHLERDRSVHIDVAQEGLRRIMGRYTFPLSPNQIITAQLEVIVLDGSAQVRFHDVTLQRSQQARSEPIFLQSIADRAHAELTNFTNTMISAIAVR